MASTLFFNVYTLFKPLVGGLVDNGFFFGEWQIEPALRKRERRDTPDEEEEIYQ